MNSLQLYENACRICLKQNAVLNWNDEIAEFYGISYKDCYYKYTALDYTGSNSFPTSLCEICSNGLKNAHMLFERALKSFNILQTVLTTKEIDSSYSDMEVCDSLITMKCEVQPFNEINNPTNNKALITPKEGFSLSHVTVPKTESTAVCEHIEPTHFIDIENFAETPFEEHLEEICTSEFAKSSSTHKTRIKKTKIESVPGLPVKKPRLQTTKGTSKKRTKCKLLGEISLEPQPKESYNTNITTNEADIQIKSKDSVVASEHTLNESTNTKSVVRTQSAKKSREKYLLMCAYCSLKVEGARKLEKHEATHNENRKRTETCPKCGLKLYTKLALNEHMKIHDENRQKNHKCEFCEKAFFNKGALNVHRRIHLGLMVKCQICLKEFFRQLDLDKHLLKHSASPLQKNVGKKKYTVECQYCNKSVFTDKWKVHIAAHLDQPQVKCKICDKKFFARSNCTKHLRQVHHKNLSEYEDLIHYYVDRNSRMSSLMMKQQLTIQTLKE